MNPMRASDQDRHEAVLALSEAYAEGRLDSEEFEARQSRALVATYLHDLDPLFADLPGRVAPASRPQPAYAVPGPRGSRPGGPRGAGAPFLAAALAALVALAFVTGGHTLWLALPVLWFAFAASRRRRWHALQAQAARPLPGGHDRW